MAHLVPFFATPVGFAIEPNRSLSQNSPIEVQNEGGVFMLQVSKNALFFLSWVSFLFYCGCAGLSSHKNEEAMAKVKKIAVIGFSVYEPASASIGLNVGQEESLA